MTSPVRLSLLCFVPLLASCSPSTPPSPPPLPPPSTEATASASALPSASAASSAPAAVVAAPIRMLPATASDPPDPMPSVAITSPRAGEVVAADKASDFAVKLDVKNWQTEPGARHVHLILDNHPYKPIYDTSKPVPLSELNGGALGEGEHVLVAFPSRPNHESVKPAKGKVPLAIVQFWVGNKGKPSFNPKAPMFVYSRPKGAYEGPKHTERLLVDFYMNNIPAGDGQWSIALSLLGPGSEGLEPFVIHDWKPYVIENLQNGEYKISMELLDKSGVPVPGPWNKATRTITVNRNAADDDKKAGQPAPEGHH